MRRLSEIDVHTPSIQKHNSIYISTTATPQNARELLSIPPADRTEDQIDFLIELTQNINFFQDTTKENGRGLHRSCCR